METQQETKDEKPLTFADLGINTAPQLTDGPLGKTRPIKDLERKEIAFAILAVVSLVAAIGLAIDKLATTSSSDPDFTFALIIIVNALFCIYYIIFGILNERPYEIVVMVIATFVVFVYIIVNFILSDHKGPVKIARLVIGSIFSPVLICLGLMIAKQYNDSGRLIFRTVGADSTLQGFCKTLFLFLGLLKFDLQLNVSMVLLILQSGSTVDTKDIIIISVGLPVTVVCFAIGYLCVRLENKILGIVFAVSFFFSPAYVIYKIYQTAADLAASTSTSAGTSVITTVQTTSELSRDALSGTTFTCAALALIFRVLMIIYFVKTVLNFGKGLKSKVYGTETENDHLTQAGTSEEGGDKP